VWISSRFCPGTSSVHYMCINDLSKIMHILSHTILYADDIKIIVTSTNYNNLYKTLNVTHQLISEWLHMKQLVLNKNKTFAISISCVKSPTHTLNIICNNQNLTLTESTDFLCTHLDTNLS